MDQQLLVLISVAEQRNFSRAAEELHLTQPAVSQHIQALEREIGTRLFDRTNKYVRLTKAGEVVYHHAKDILALYNRMQRLVDDMMNTEKGSLSIGASYTYGEYLLPHMIARFRKRYPLITPTITIENTSEVIDHVANHHLDVGIIEGEVDVTVRGLQVEPFADDFMIIVVATSHPLSQEHEISVEDLSGETWIMRESGSGTRSVTDRVFSSLNFTPQSTMEFGSTQVIKEAVEAGLGVSILSQSAIRKELALGTLRALRIRDFPITRKFSLVTQDSPFQTKALAVFVDYLRSKAQ